MIIIIVVLEWRRWQPLSLSLSLLLRGCFRCLSTEGNFKDWGKEERKRLATIWKLDREKVFDKEILISKVA